MAIDAYTNFAFGKVLTAPSPATTGTALTLEAGHGARLPATPFNATVWPPIAYPDPTTAEIVRVTARVGDVLTIVRGAESTLARLIVAGDALAVTVTKKVLDDLRDASNMNAGTLPDARLSSNVQLKPIAVADLPATVATTPIAPADGGTGVTTGLTQLNATNLTSGTVPDARLSANVVMKPIDDADLPAHHATHEPGGADAIMALDAGALTTGTVPDARLSANVARRDQTNAFTQENAFQARTTLEATNPQLALLGTGAPAGTKRWKIANNNPFSTNDLIINTENDAGTGTGGLNPPAVLVRRTGVVQMAWGLGATPLDASQLASGTVPDARLSANVVVKPMAAADLPAHAARHQPGGPDALAVDAAAAVGSLRTLGTDDTSACAGDDPRLFNARVPLAHASNHQAAGNDPLALDTLAAPTDVTTLNASPSAHGLLPKLSNVATHFLNGVGVFTVPTATAGAHAPNHEPGGSDPIANLSAAILTSGTLPDGRLSANIPRLNVPNTFTSSITAQAGEFTSLGTTPLNATQLTSGTVADARLSTNVALRNSRNDFSANQQVRKSVPRYQLWDTGQAADARLFEFASASGTLYIQALNDAENAASGYVTINRSGDFFAGRNISANNGVLATAGFWEYGRANPLGTWIGVAFNAADYSSNAGTWVVEAGDVIWYRYCLIGKVLIIDYRFATTTVTGAPTVLMVAAPAGLTFVSASHYTLVPEAADSSGNIGVRVQVVDGSRWGFLKVNNTAFAAGTNNVHLGGQLIASVS
jgi:hypothetical protein